jgi:hypothetical protein
MQIGPFYAAQGHTTMKTVFVLLIVMLAARWLPAQGTTAVSWTPLLLYTNGAGQISNFHNGQMVQAGQRYFMGASPNRDSVFANWQQVKMDIEVKTVVYPSGLIVITTNTVVSPTGQAFNRSWMSFTMEPTKVTLRNDNPGSSVITEYKGWQANFAKGYGR